MTIGTIADHIKRSSTRIYLEEAPSALVEQALNQCSRVCLRVGFYRLFLFNYRLQSWSGRLVSHRHSRLLILLNMQQKFTSCSGIL